jgi:membrane-associated phospholipid phosphatase
MISALARQLRAHAVLAAMVAVYAVVAFLLGQAKSEPVDFNKFTAVFMRFATLVPQMIFMVLFWRLLHLTYIDRVPDRMSVMKAEVRAFIADRNRMLGGFVAAVIMTAMLVSFAQLKSQIPLLQPFVWDEYFAELDRKLHFGTLPHEYLHAVFGWHYSISFFTGIYNVWLFMMYFALVIACFLRTENPVRLRYLIAFVLTWAIGGNLLATLFSSAGPVYYDDLGLGDTYASLMQRLEAHAATGALTVIDTQNLLWTWYTMDRPINAISAFPSMHVASTTLMALFAFCWHRRAGMAVTAFATGIMIGSVLLGWHYAVDGYVGAVVALLSWHVAGWIVRAPLPGLQPARQA